MKRRTWVMLVLLVALAGHAEYSSAHLLPRPRRLVRLNTRIHGQVVDHTRNHGADLRFWSPALGQKRDMYVYLPPGFDPCKRYPVAIYMHGFLQDELSFIDHVVKPFDAAIACGKLPPLILAAPDASVHGIDCIATTGTFFLNSNLGRYEDYLVHDVYDFLMTNYPIRPEPEAHALLGVSMGGGAAFAKAFRFPDKFRVVASAFPPLNLRWISCRGKYMDNFDPNCWCWRTDFSRGHEPVGLFFGGLVKVRMRSMIYPLHGRRTPNLAALVSRDNPIEMLDTCQIQPGVYKLYIGYGGNDEFNIDAQIESFLHRAREKGIDVCVGHAPDGRHDVATALKLLPAMLNWLGEQIGPYSPR